ncbi:DUF5672 family protein [Novosphingobium sp. ZW T3_23]|uniref:DUF5672 family protein n=1 Tax=Novosphingobium sp. ZW T3_23 TaxID=3378084 RepID=UPI0038550CA9
MERKARLQLPQVTLCAVTSVNVEATVRALDASLKKADFGACKLLTDVAITPSDPRIEVVAIEQLTSSAAYSNFILTRLIDFVDTSHCLVAQWDGHVVDSAYWKTEFLEYDYIGASWPQFPDGYDVGNGGFSLRSQRLMELCRNPDFTLFHPEDLAIGRVNRAWLEKQGIVFPPRDLADVFAAERKGNPKETFGYHGVWNMPDAIGLEAYWQVYLSLDDRGTIRPDFSRLLRTVGRGRGGLHRMAKMLADRIRPKSRKAKTYTKAH